MNLIKSACPYFSIPTTADAVRILQQTLNNNGGPLSAGTGIAPDSQIWWLRAGCNLIAMLSMLGSLIVLICLLLKTGYFGKCIAAAPEETAAPAKKEGILIAVCTIVLTILCLLKANSGGPVWANPFGTRWFPNLLRLVTTSAIAVWFIVWLAVASLVLLVVRVLLAKKKGFAALNLGMGVRPVLRTVLLAAIVLAFGNAQLVVIERLFHQDFRFWQLMFGEMKVEHWLVALPYGILFLVCYLILGCAVNYGRPTALGNKKDMLSVIAVNSAGVWLLCLFCTVMWYVSWKGAAISDFTLSYSMLLFVPLTVYSMRKLYQVTHSVWMGALLNAWLLAWTLVSSAGIADRYYGQNIIDILFGV